MSKSTALVRIVNPHPGCGTYTSKRNADRMVARGLAVSVGQHAIRLLEEEEVRAERRRCAEVRAEERYWREVAAQHGGGDVAFIWQPTSVPAYPGAPRELGYRVMGARAVIVNRGQLAQGASVASR